jgi:hypothetical protein
MKALLTSLFILTILFSVIMIFGFTSTWVGSIVPGVLFGPVIIMALVEIHNLHSNRV